MSVRKPAQETADVLAEALWLHDQGLWVVPCRGKIPAVKNWPTDRLIHADVKTLLKRRPTLNIAIVLNQSPWLDVECDTDEAETALQGMCGGSIPKTPTWQSRRGKHRLFMRPDRLPQTTAVLKPDGVEFRGLITTAGAISVVPPSIHPESKKRYEWLPGLSLHDLQPATLPDSVITRLRAPASPTATAVDDGPLGNDDILEGERNNELFKIACRLVRSRVTQESAARMLLAENQARCKPPLPDSEVMGIVRSAYKDRDGQDKPTNAEILLDIVMVDSELWHTPDGMAFATIRRDGHHEHWPVRAKGFKLWLAKQFYDLTGSAVGAQTMQDVVGTLEAKAMFDGPEYQRFLRVAGHEDKIYIDLVADDWRVIEVSSTDWRIITDPPVRFHRPKRMLPFPLPQRGGSFAELRRFLNVTDDGWCLVLAWLVAALRPVGPYPILKTLGEQGTAKTTVARVLRAFVDPNTCPTRGAPHTERDLMIAAENGWVCAFDNLSYVTPELSDALCRLSTGGGFGVRTHYENDEETVFHSKRPIILNGIEDIGTRSDLMDRALVVELPRLADKDRLPERAFDRKFEEACPRIFGALLDALVVALRNLPEVEKSNIIWPRMADFAQWAVAAEEGLRLRPGQFLEVYKTNRETAHQTALETTPVVPALYALMKSRNGKFEGTTTELLEALGAGQDTRVKGWPKAAQPLSGLLRRLAPDLRAAGFFIDHSRKNWIIELPPKPAPAGSREFWVCTSGIADTAAARMTEAQLADWFSKYPDQDPAKIPVQLCGTNEWHPASEYGFKQASGAAAGAERS
jgi:hypothetical protein